MKYVYCNRACLEKDPGSGHRMERTLIALDPPLPGSEGHACGCSMCTFFMYWPMDPRGLIGLQIPQVQKSDNRQFKAYDFMD